MVNLKLHAARVVVVLPVYNEALHLPGLLRQIDAVMRREGLGFQIIAVDDGSSDETPLILDEQTRKFPLTVHRHATNQGLGSTIRDGLRAAVAAASDHDVVVTMDADETHLPELIPGMARMVREGCDVVIASRYQPGSAVVGLSLRRRILSGCASLMFRAAFPTLGVRDFTCGFRAYGAGMLRRAFSSFGDRFAGATGFECMVDILLTLRRLDAVFGEIPMVLRYDLKLDVSKMRVARTIRSSFSVLARHRFGRLNIVSPGKSASTASGS